MGVLVVISLVVVQWLTGHSAMWRMWTGVMGSLGPNDRSLDGVPDLANLQCPSWKVLDGQGLQSTTHQWQGMWQRRKNHHFMTLFIGQTCDNGVGWFSLQFSDKPSSCFFRVVACRIRFKPDYWRGLAGYLGPINKVWGVVRPGLALHYITSNTLHPSFKYSLAWPMPWMSWDVEVDSCIIAPLDLSPPKCLCWMQMWWRISTCFGEKKYSTRAFWAETNHVLCSGCWK